MILDEAEAKYLLGDGRQPDARSLQAALPTVIQAAEKHIKPIKQAFDANCRQRLELELPRQQVLLLEPLLEPVGSGVRQTYG